VNTEPQSVFKRIGDRRLFFASERSGEMLANRVTDYRQRLHVISLAYFNAFIDGRKTLSAYRRQSVQMNSLTDGINCSEGDSEKR
jgi:hypothetical protein